MLDAIDFFDDLIYVIMGLASIWLFMLVGASVYMSLRYPGRKG